MIRKPKSFISSARKAATSLCIGLMGLSTLSGPALAQDPPRTLYYPSGWEKCAEEGGTCNFPGGLTDVAYGANGQYTYLLAARDYVQCNSNNFGDDPIRGVRKSCYWSKSGSRLKGLPICAAENKNCTITGPGTIWYGVHAQFVPKIIDQDDGVTSNVACSVQTFGQDPYPGQAKYCILQQ